MRGLVAAACRDSIYVTGMLAVTPMLQRKLEEKRFSPAAASLYASLIGTILYYTLLYSIHYFTLYFTLYFTIHTLLYTLLCTPL
jgi:hypothetical protein